MSTRIGLWVECPLLRSGLEVFVKGLDDTELVVDDITPTTTDLMIIFLENPFNQELKGLPIPKILITTRTSFQEQEIKLCNIQGVVPLRVSYKTLTLAIDCLLHKNNYIDPEIHLVQISETTGKRALTSREHEILKFLAEGKKVKDIAQDLDLSHKTVEAHKFNLMRKLDIHNKVGLARYAIENGIITT